MTSQLARAVRAEGTRCAVTGVAGLTVQPPGAVTENVTWSSGSRPLLSSVAVTVVVLPGVTSAGVAATVSEP